MDVLIPKDLVRRLEPHEIDVARFLSQKLKTNIEFIVPMDGFRRKTPDIVMYGVLWEIKSPTGAARTTISKQIKDAVKQCDSIILDGRRTSIVDQQIVQQLKKEILLRKRIKRLLFINKRGQIITVK